MTVDTQLLLVDGKQIPAADGRTFTVLDPSDGTAITTVTAPPVRPGSGTSTSSRPSAYSTYSSSAACTSSWSPLSRGYTLTVVSVRSLAAMWTWPSVRLSTTRTGAGVSNVGMASRLRNVCGRRSGEEGSADDAD